MVRNRIALGRLAAAAGLAVLLCLASLVGALADVLTVPLPSPSGVDLSPLLVEGVNMLIVVGAPAIGALALALLLRLYRLAGVKVTAERGAALRATIDQGLTQAAAFARARTGAVGPIVVDVGHPAIAIGAGYAIEAIPEALKDLGITDAASERLGRMVEARLGAPAAVSAV